MAGLRYLALAASLLWMSACPRGEALEPFVRLSEPVPAKAPKAKGAVLYAFWAEWCAPCVEEAPALKALAQEPPDGMSVVVVGMDDDLQAARRRFGSDVQLALGDTELASAFRVSALPTSLLAVDGRLVARFEGPRAWDARRMRQTLDRLIAQQAPVR